MKKMIPKLVDFERELLKQIKAAAKKQHIGAALWIRIACREKLEREKNNAEAQS